MCYYCINSIYKLYNNSIMYNISLLITCDACSAHICLYKLYLRIKINLRIKILDYLFHLFYSIFILIGSL